MSADRFAQPKLGRVCVYCGSSQGRDPAYAEQAERLARTLASENIGLVYGGASVGVMGLLADAALAEGGEVIGVIPGNLMHKEVAHQGLTDLKVVSSMHERKACMADLADAFIALPGGLGTLEELFEVLTWAQLGLHGKPCALLNTRGYYDQLARFLDHAVAEEFIKPKHRSMLIVEEDPVQLVQACATYASPEQGQWITPGRT